MTHLVAGVIVALSIGALVYVMFGYPLLLPLLVRRLERPIQRGPIQPTISIILAVHNGEAYLAAKLDSILALDYPHDRTEILVISDGSFDRTDEIAESYAGRNVRLIRLERGGKPAALNAAMKVARNEILVFTDVRQAMARDSVRLLVEAFADPTVGAVSGDLIIRSGQSHEEANIGLYRRLETYIRDNLSRIDSMFGAMGAFYALRRSLAVNIPPETLLDDVYLPLTAFFRGYRLVVDPRAHIYDDPTSLDTEFRRKVRTLAGNYQMLQDFPALLGPRNRMWFHFMSYKFGRLVLPWCLIALAIASFALPDPWRALILLGQCAFYTLALLDPLIGSGPVKAISSPARTFVAMMIAALRALSVFVVPPRSLWSVPTTTGSKPQIKQ